MPRIESVTPNPARGALRVAYARGGGAPAGISLHDARGRLVLTRSLAAAALVGSHGVVVLDPGAGAPSGVYFVRLHEGSRIATSRVCFLR